MGHTLHHQGLNLDAELLRGTSREPRRHAERRGQGRRRGRSGVSASYAIAVARFYEDLAERLVAGARAAFAEAGVEDVEVFDVPGAFELPLAASYAAGSGRFAGVACLGAVIRGETDHYDYVCAEAARGIMESARRPACPCASAC